jgi:DNA helicase-2/ATP-dependent DNA helicase PcrA
MTKDSTSVHTSFNISLNEHQHKAVTPEKGVLLVCAGAGSGKTRVITSRIAHLILNHNVNPESIIALTFTNKAAREMKERVMRTLSQHYDKKEYKLPFVGTFHSYCLRLLKQYGSLLSLGSFTLFDSQDKEKLVKSLIQKYGLSKQVTPKNVMSFISRIKNDHAVNQFDMDTTTDPHLVDLYHYYEQSKKQSKCLDFDDLLQYGLKLFSHSPEFKKRYQEHVRHILVDEYQDTNVVQHALLKHMAQTSDQKFALDSLCVVGDEDQSIYSWRGATVSNIINFDQDFPTCTHITIEQNYRSVEPILNLANNIITYNTYRNPKKLWSDKKASDRIRLIQCGSNSQEGMVVAELFDILHKQKNLSSCAVLYRSHYQSRSLEEALIRKSIPYKVVGGLQFYERQEIKDILAYLKLVINPFDRVSLYRVINVPARGLGPKFQHMFDDLWHEYNEYTFKDICSHMIEHGLITGVKKESLVSFMTLFTDIDKDTSISHAIDHIIKSTQYYKHLEKIHEKEDAQTKKENIKELIDSVVYFEQEKRTSIAEFLDEVSLLQELSAHAQDSDNYVKLMTLHAAKGLEFDTVVLTGLEEGVLPSGRSLYQPETLEEERRLLYVGLTRACEHLLITYSRFRYAYGQMTDQRRSRFVDEFDESLVSYADSTYWRKEDMHAYLASWLKYSSPGINTDTPDKKRVFQKDASSPKPTKKTGLKKLQPVTHAIFGTGIIQKVEKKNNGSTFVTVRFRAGTKKLDSRFIKTSSL